MLPSFIEIYILNFVLYSVSTNLSSGNICFVEIILKNFFARAESVRFAACRRSSQVRKKEKTPSALFSLVDLAGIEPVSENLSV